MTTDPDIATIRDRLADGDESEDEDRESDKMKAIRQSANAWRDRFDACERVERQLTRLGIHPDDLRDWLDFGNLP